MQLKKRENDDILEQNIFRAGINQMGLTRDVCFKEGPMAPILCRLM